MKIAKNIFEELGKKMKINPLEIKRNVEEQQNSKEVDSLAGSDFYK
jgi:hypothetical protein